MKVKKKTLSERVQMQKRFKLERKNTKQKLCLWSWGTKYAREEWLPSTPEVTLSQRIQLLVQQK